MHSISEEFRMLAMIEASDQMRMLAPQRSASLNIRRVGGRGHSGRPHEEHEACLTPNFEGMCMPFGKVGSPDEEVGIIQYLE